ncbi:MAG TPA: hypothetical protein VG755_31585 [Nannocystaceae bacterium]|nr:hypothetical protein [Nannocystaceae bacterium]
MFVSLPHARGLTAALLLLTSACIINASDDDVADSSDGGTSSADESTTAADESSSSSGGSTGSTDSLEIAGEWVDDFMGTHSITDTQWVQGYGTDVYTYTIDHYDNDGDVLIAQSADDMTWARFDWTTTEDGALYYCQTAFGAASAEEAEATPRADDSDPAMGGCAMFAWSALNPA